MYNELNSEVNSLQQRRQRKGAVSKPRRLERGWMVSHHWWSWDPTCYLTVVDPRHCGNWVTGSMAGGHLKASGLGNLTRGHPTISRGQVTRTVNFNWMGNSAWKTRRIRVINSCTALKVILLVESLSVKEFPNP